MTTEIGLKVLENRFLRRDTAGNLIETPAQAYERTARVIAEVERNYGADEATVEAYVDTYAAMMSGGLFLPGGRTLANAGLGIQLSNCYVLPVADTLESIYQTMAHKALIQKQGGGTGFDFSTLRASGSPVHGTGGMASGPVSFMTLYNASTEAVRQGGGRRGANMGILRVDHPDIMDFITCKRDTSKITNFNISVAITDAFMDAVYNDSAYELVDPRTGEVAVAPKGGLVNPLSGEVIVAEGALCYVSARYIFDMIVDNAWNTGEPGIFYIDQANRHNPVPHMGRYNATNPCGEIPLLPYDVCNLGSINVGAFARQGELYDWDGLAKAVRLATRFLDNVIEANVYPLPEIDALSKAIRRIGLGVMGYADTLIRLGIPYDSDRAIEFAKRLMAFIEKESHAASEELAQERGVFPEWERSVWGPDTTCARNERGWRARRGRRMRNCNITAIAPTGTISMIAGCSSGIEPIFAVAFARRHADGGIKALDINADFVARAQAEGWYSEELMTRIAETGHIHHEEVPTEVQRVFRTAHDISPEYHIRTQAAFQDHTDNAISKTCNFPYEGTRDEIAQSYMLAHSLGCKGVTVYRDGSRGNQVLSTGATGGATAAPTAEPVANTPEDISGAQEPAQGVSSEYKTHLPADRLAMAHDVDTPLGKMHVFVTLVGGAPVELFSIIGRAGSDLAAFNEAIGRLVSLALRRGVPVNLIADQLIGIGGEARKGFGPNRVNSVPDALGRLLARYAFLEAAPELLPYPFEPGDQLELEDAQATVPGLSFPDHPVMPVAAAAFAEVPLNRIPFDAGTGKLTGGTCPECGGMSLRKIEGCTKCESCGYAAC